MPGNIYVARLAALARPGCSTRHEDRSHREEEMANRRFMTPRPSLAVAVIACLVLGPAVSDLRAAQSPMAETGHGSIRGTLYQTDESTRLAGAKVTAINVRTG